MSVFSISLYTCFICLIGVKNLSNDIVNSWMKTIKHKNEGSSGMSVIHKKAKTGSTASNKIYWIKLALLQQLYNIIVVLHLNVVMLCITTFETDLSLFVLFVDDMFIWLYMCEYMCAWLYVCVCVCVCGSVFKITYRGVY